MGFPRWFYHNDFPDGRIFQREEDVPPGCVSNPFYLQPQPLPPAKPNGTARDIELLGGNVLPSDVHTTETRPAAKTPLPNWDDDEPRKNRPGRPRKAPKEG